ncbi:MAG: YdbC family protein [Anaerovoracaceae bacterium]
MEFKIIDQIAVISRRGTWSLELNVVKWGEHEPKYDLRTWNDDHSKCSKGITLTENEAGVLLNALTGRLKGAIVNAE